MSCLECGAVFPPRAKGCGNQPGFCSTKCRLSRKRKTYQQWVEKNHARKLALDAAYRSRFKQAQSDYFRKYYANNKEQKKQAAREWYQANAAYAYERQKAYVATRPVEVRRALGRRNRAKRRAIEKQVFVEVVDQRVVFVRDKGVCGICSEPVDMTSNWEVDHVIPISKGGTHCYANVQLAHRRCNRSKGAKCA